jgi:hypothetical protein
MNFPPRALAALLAIAIGLVTCPGCGIKTRVRAPEDVRPEQIVDLSATSVADGIRLSWTRPDRYQNRDPMRDLNDFLVLRGSDNQPMAQIAKLPITDQQRFQQQHHMLLVDKDALMNHRYRYRIISETSDGYQSLPSNEVVLERTPPRQFGNAQPGRHLPAANSHTDGTAPAAQAP